MESKKKVVYILSNIHNRYIAFEWIAKNIDKNKIAISFILIQKEKSYLENYFYNNDINYSIIYYYGKGKLEFLKTLFKVIFLLMRNRPDVVHTHIFDANLIGLLASKLLFIKKRIYTRHVSTADIVYFPESIKYRKIINFLATDIIAVSKVVEDVLIKNLKVNKNKIHLLYHGFDMQEYTNISSKRIEDLKEKYKTFDYPVVGVVSTFQELKGIKYIIEAFKLLLSKYPNAILVLANAKGKDYDKIQKQLIEMIPEKSFIEIPFEDDISALFHIFDVFIHVPIDKSVEAFGQVYIESMACGTPCVCTLSGIANEIIENKKNAIVVDYKNPNQIYDAVIEMLENKELRENIIKNAKKSVNQFSLQEMLNKLEKIYLL